jgi:hypothetical protein
MYAPAVMPDCMCCEIYSFNGRSKRVGKVFWPSANFFWPSAILSDRKQIFLTVSKFLSQVSIFCQNVAIEPSELLEKNCWRSEKIADGQKEFADRHPHDNRAGQCFTLRHIRLRMETMFASSASRVFALFTTPFVWPDLPVPWRSYVE